MKDKELKLSERMQDTQNRRCDNNDIDYGYNMAIDDFIGEVEKLERQNKQLRQEKKELILYKNIVTILEGSYYNCQGCSINTPDILLKDLILDIKKQLLLKIKGQDNDK
jgi:hypothetical protein